MAAAAFFGLVLGVAALVVSLALLSGFQTHVRERLVNETPHVVVTPAGRAAFGADEEVGPRLRRLGGVTSVEPVARGRVWLGFRSQLVTLEAVGRGGATGLAIDPAQARNLGAFLGDEVTVVSSRTRLSPLGPVPIVSKVTLGGLPPPTTGRRAAEATLPLDEARRLFALADGEATAFELRLSEPNAAPAVATAVRSALGAGVVVTTWEDANRALVLALRLERWVLFATIFLVVVVAGLNLAATAAVLAATRSGDAAVLSVLGAAPRNVAAVFVGAGAALGVAGTIVGAVVGAGVAFGLDATGVIPLPARLYGLAHVPFRVDPLDLAAVVVLSSLWVFVAASVPARAVARLDVSEVLRSAA